MQVSASLASVTQTAQPFDLTALVDNNEKRCLCLYDTPGLQDTSDGDFEKMLKTIKVVDKAGGYIAVIVCVDTSRFTEDDWNSLEYVVQ